MSGSYWDDPAVQEAEAEYEAAVKAKASAAEIDAKMKAFDDAMAAAKRKLDKARHHWQSKHPGEKPPWRGAGGDDNLGPVPRPPWER